MLIGPNAVLALSRKGYTYTDLDWYEMQRSLLNCACTTSSTLHDKMNVTIVVPPRRSEQVLM